MGPNTTRSVLSKLMNKWVSTRVNTIHLQVLHVTCLLLLLHGDCKVEEQFLVKIVEVEKPENLQTF